MYIMYTLIRNPVCTSIDLRRPEKHITLNRCTFGLGLQSEKIEASHSVELHNFTNERALIELYNKDKLDWKTFKGNKLGVGMLCLHLPSFASLVMFSDLLSPSLHSPLTVTVIFSAGGNLSIFECGDMMFFSTIGWKELHLPQGWSPSAGLRLRPRSRDSHTRVL